MRTARSPVRHIPPPEAVQSRLAELTRERFLLRGLLRLSRRKAEADARTALQQKKGA